jgi:HAD superfamily hydrolase (TIGR01549 family)
MFNPSELKVVFFDIGNVFVSDDPSGCFAYRCLYDRLHSEGQNLTPEEFFRRRTEHVQEGGGLWSFVGQYVDEQEFKSWQRDVRARMYSQWAHLSPAVELMAEVPARLAPHYRLGIIANQPGEVEAVMAERGLLDYFEIRAISDTLNLHKPNPEFYRWAIREAGVEPHETLMIGDRIDNDVRPAKSVGMRTAWLRLGHEARGWKPATEFEEHYHASNILANWSDYPPEGPADEPDLIVHSAEELISALVPKSQ